MCTVRNASVVKLLMRMKPRAEHYSIYWPVWFVVTVRAMFTRSSGKQTRVEIKQTRCMMGTSTVKSRAHKSKWWRNGGRSGLHPRHLPKAGANNGKSFPAGSSWRLSELLEGCGGCQAVFYADRPSAAADAFESFSKTKTHDQVLCRSHVERDTCRHLVPGIQ